MNIRTINENIKCDSILCFQNAMYELTTNSYKGNQYLCQNCYKKYQKLFKESKKNNEN